MGLLQDIQDAVVDGQTDLPTLLRKSKILAVRLKFAPLGEWVDSELNGYPKGSELPAYRIVPTQSFGNFSDGYWNRTLVPIPLHVLNGQNQDAMRAIRLRDGVAAYSDMVQRSNDAVMKIGWPPELVHYLGGALFDDETQCLGAWRALPRSAIVELLSAVQNRILAFAIELERIAPDAGEATAKRPVIEPSQVAPVYHNVFYGGAHNVAVNHHQFSQTQQSQISRGDLAGLRAFLAETGVEDEDIENLAKIVQEEQPHGIPLQLGDRARAWIGQVTSKAALGTGTGLAVAGIEHVVKAIAAYYGIG